jgi:hypothetical protein
MQLVMLHAQECCRTRIMVWKFNILHASRRISYTTLSGTNTYPDVEESAFLLVLLKMGLVHYLYQPKNKIKA